MEVVVTDGEERVKAETSEFDPNPDAECYDDVDNEVEIIDPLTGARRYQSLVWKYFDNLTPLGPPVKKGRDSFKIVKCRLCAGPAGMLQAKGSSTAPMRTHLKSHHPPEWKVLNSKRREVGEARGVSEQQDVVATKRRRPAHRVSVTSTRVEPSSSTGTGACFL